MHEMFEIESTFREKKTIFSFFFFARGEEVELCTVTLYDKLRLPDTHNTIYKYICFIRLQLFAHLLLCKWT